MIKQFTEVESLYIWIVRLAGFTSLRQPNMLIVSLNSTIKHTVIVEMVKFLPSSSRIVIKMQLATVAVRKKNPI